MRFILLALLAAGLTVNCGGKGTLGEFEGNTDIGDIQLSGSVKYNTASGGAPCLVTDLGPSYWHGWSPDGKTLAYCAEHNGEYDIYTIPVNGGKEKRLTDAPGLDDGPDYSPDGNYIYINSARTGLMKIWRMKTDGSEQVQITIIFQEYKKSLPNLV